MKNKKHTSGFRIPKNYFEEFEDVLFTKLSERDIPSAPGFKVPEGYFENVEDKTFQRLLPVKKEFSVISLSRQNMVYIAGIAAVFILFFTLFNLYAPAHTDMNMLQLTTIESYIDEGNLDLNAYEITGLLGEEISSLDAGTHLFSEETLENYLLEDIDETLLLIE